MKRKNHIIMDFHGKEANNENVIELAKFLQHQDLLKLLKSFKFRVFSAETKKENQDTKGAIFAINAKDMLLVVSKNQDEKTIKKIYAFAILAYIFEINCYSIYGYSMVFNQNFELDPLVQLFEREFFS